MTAYEYTTLRIMAEDFRRRGGLIEGKYGKLTWVQSINVLEAFQQCAQELEQFCATLENIPQKPAPPETALGALQAAVTTNPS